MVIVFLAQLFIARKHRLPIHAATNEAILQPPVVCGASRRYHSASSVMAIQGKVSRAVLRADGAGALRACDGLPRVISGSQVQECCGTIQLGDKEITEGVIIRTR